MRTALLLSLVLLSACDDGRVEYVSVTPSFVEIRKKDEIGAFDAQLIGKNGKPKPQVKITWSVADPTVASVDGDGRVRGLKSGRTEVIATAGKASANGLVDVLLVEKIEVEPASVEVHANQDGQELTVRAFDYRGRELKDRPATFRALDTKVVTTRYEIVFGNVPGKTQVEVSVGDATKLIDVTVKK